MLIIARIGNILGRL